jgi:putative ABC transport system permease protein
MEIRPLLSALWRSRTGPVLIGLQVAIALAVLVNVAYVIEQRAEAYRRPTGIDIDNIFWVLSQGFSADYNHKATVEADLAYLNGIPGVVAAAASHNLPQTNSSTGMPFSTKPGERVAIQPGILYFMSARGIDALGLKLIAGRGPSADVVMPPANDVMEALGRWSAEIVITQALALKLFPHGDALGKTVYVGLVNRSSKIVGIIDTMQAIPMVGAFAPIMQQVVIVPAVPPGPLVFYLVRTAPGRQGEVMTKVEKEFADRQPGRFIAHMETLRKTAANTRDWMRSSSIILGVVALLVLAVTAIGIFGLAAFNVTTRTKQIGTRRAIGARRFHILRYFLVENWLTTTSGVIIGCVLALALGVKLSLMFQAPRMPLYYLVIGVLTLWALGLSAVWVPGRRAAAISPAVATRTV